MRAKAIIAGTMALLLMAGIIVVGISKSTLKTNNSKTISDYTPSQMSNEFKHIYVNHLLDKKAPLQVCIAMELLMTEHITQVTGKELYANLYYRVLKYKISQASIDLDMKLLNIHENHIQSDKWNREQAQAWYEMMRDSKNNLELKLESDAKELTDKYRTYNIGVGK